MVLVRAGGGCFDAAVSVRPTPPAEALVVSLSARGQVCPVVGIGLFLLAALVLWRLDLLPGWLALVSGVEFGAIVVLGTVVALRSRRWGWVLRLDEDGVTVRDHERVPWSDLSGVTVTSMRPRWLFDPPWLVRRWRRPDRYPVVALLPRSGVELPAPRLPGGPGPRDRLAALRRRRYGTSLVLLPHATDVSVDQLLVASCTWGHLPVDVDASLATRGWHHAAG